MDRARVKSGREQGAGGIGRKGAKLSEWDERISRKKKRDLGRGEWDKGD